MTGENHAAYATGWIGGVLDSGLNYTPGVTVNAVEALSDTTLAVHLSDGAMIRLDVAYHPEFSHPPVKPAPQISQSQIAKIFGIKPAPADVMGVSKTDDAVDLADEDPGPPLVINGGSKIIMDNASDVWQALLAETQQQHPVPDAAKVMSTGFGQMDAHHPYTASATPGECGTCHLDYGSKIHLPPPAVTVVDIKLRVMNWLKRLDAHSPGNVSYFLFGAMLMVPSLSKGNGVTVEVNRVIKQHNANGSKHAHAWVDLQTGQIFTALSWSAVGNLAYDVSDDVSYAKLKHDCTLLNYMINKEQPVTSI